MENEKVIIEKVGTYSDELLRDINSLGPQLDPKFEPLNKETLESMIDTSDTHILVARDTQKDTVIGMITLCIYRIPYKKKAWLEDLVVDQAYRGQGIATRLIQKGLGIARENQVGSVNLTSQPIREVANKIYLSLGFEKRDTNVYRLTLGS